MDDAPHSRALAMGPRSTGTGISLDRVASFCPAMPILVGALYARGDARCDSKGFDKKDYSTSPHRPLSPCNYHSRSRSSYGKSCFSGFRRWRRLARGGSAMSKVTAEHLARIAYVYIRQSTPGQVRNNLESQRRQYALTKLAHELGWKEVKVIDDDQGMSG